MCVIVHQPSDAYLSKRTAEQMWERNPDGAGFAFINDDGRIETGKAMNFESFWRQFESKRSVNRDKDFLVHFRIATSGKIGLDNTHPFVVDEYTVMAHNGMLNSIVGNIPREAELSDTREFIEKVVKELPEDWLDNPTLVRMMEDYIGFSKLMFLTTNPALKENVYILNRDQGDDVHKMWWSNKYHVPRPKPELPLRAKKEVTYVSKARVITEGLGPRATERKEKEQGRYAKKKKEEEKNRKVVNINDYKVPLPRSTSKDENRPTQAEVEAFWLQTELPGVLSYEVLPEDTDHAFEAMMALRKESGLTDDVLFEPVSESYECQKCYNLIDDDSGDCLCWDMICIACGAMAPYCVHASGDDELVLVNEAFKAYNERKESLELPTTL